MKDKNAPDWYVAAPDTIRGQEPRIRKTMPAIRDNGTGKEVAVITNYSQDHANLIAAAPEMREALQELVTYYKAAPIRPHMFTDAGSFYQAVEERNEVLDRAEEVISKAKGES